MLTTALKMSSTFSWQSACWPDDLARNAKGFCRSYLSSPSRRYVFGCNSWANSIADNIPVIGFIDDFYPHETFGGLPVLRRVEAPRDALVVSAVVGERPLTAISNLRRAGLVALDYFAFQKFSGIRLEPVTMLDEFFYSYSQEHDRYEKFYEKLDDVKSKKTFDDLMSFRLTSCISYMEGYQDLQAHQYFEDFLGLGDSGEIFVDCGCFDGYTSEYFSRVCPDYKAIHVLEPISANMIRVRDRLSNLERVHYHPFGASDHEAVLRFRASGSSSAQCSSGDLEVQVRRLDEIVPDGCSFLKMDIEGGELQAIKGAANMIQEFKPRLAIAAYHRPSDFLEISDHIMALNPGYRISLRHYTEGVTETVLFFYQSNH